MGELGKLQLRVSLAIPCRVSLFVVLSPLLPVSAVVELKLLLSKIIHDS